LQQAFRAETAVNVDRWLSSPGWQLLVETVADGASPKRGTRGCAPCSEC
jgi:hypothetical protein